MAEAVKERQSSFQYVAMAEQGRVVKGKLKATSEAAAQNLLQERGYAIIRLQQAPSPFSLEGAFPTLFKVKPKEVSTFSQQLATLLESGMGLLPSIQLLRTQAAVSRPMRKVLNSITSDLASGNSFSQAIAKHPEVFNEIYSRTMSVGEKTGKLETVLRQMAQHMERQGAFTKKLSGALTYPAMLFTLGIGVSLVLLIVVLPPLTSMFTQMNVALPLPTRILMAASGFLNSFKLYLLILVAIGIPAGLWFIKQPRGRALFERLKLRIPVLGNLILLGELARFTRSMAVMLTAGLSLQEIMELMPSTTTNSLFRNSLKEIRQGLFLGQGLTQPMSRNPLFPPLLVQMIAVGEESNSLETNLKVLADFYETTAEEKTSAMISLIQPLSTVAMAGMAGFIALSVVMPIYSLTGSIK